ncbi:hypothetical protein [Rhodopila sp.]|uniref:hypothetical protein n=1 Tax=Rhodopila sp. TaxID=2480087 RepID=UPI003D0E5A0E
MTPVCHAKAGHQAQAQVGDDATPTGDPSASPVPTPPPLTPGHNAYVFERAAKRLSADTPTRHGFIDLYSCIDLYKRGCFILEAKQSRQAEGSHQRPYRAAWAPNRCAVRRRISS